MIPERGDNKKYSYADYLTFSGEERFELINGEVWNMSPAPSPEHQRIAASLTSEFYGYLKGKSCEVFPAPFDVRLVKDENQREQDIYTTVQPDLSVVCDKAKIDEKGCLGAPDLIVEILSPSTGYKDETQKLTIYEEYGVREYWIVNPERKTIQVFPHNGQEFDKPAYYKGDNVITSLVLKGFQISLKDLFRE